MTGLDPIRRTGLHEGAFMHPDDGLVRSLQAYDPRWAEDAGADRGFGGLPLGQTYS